MNRRESADEIEAAAAHWVWRLDRDGRSPELQAELDTWLEGDTRRRGAWLRAEAAWAMLDRGGQLAATRTLAESMAPPPTDRRRFFVRGAAAIAACAAAVVAVLIFPSSDRFETRTGEIRRVPLEDGSTAAINTQSVVEIAMTPRARIVKVGRGEAWFQVAPNTQRPFIVEIGRARVRAVGTAFSVRRRDHGADVIVTEGVVEAWADGAEGHKVSVAAGAKAFIADDAAITELPANASENDRELAWRAGKIDLSGETLAEAVAEFNRYNDRKLQIVDPKLEQARFYGVFRTDDPAGFASAVQQSLGSKETAPLRISE